MNDGKEEDNISNDSMDSTEEGHDCSRVKYIMDEALNKAKTTKEVYDSHTLQYVDADGVEVPLGI